MTLGNVGKDGKYLGRIKRATDERIAPSHPRHHGVKMQAHHILSAEGVKMSGLGPKLEKLGYDINLEPNLVFLPSTLQGACHLGVQLHRGNHTAKVAVSELDDDADHPKNYHKLVKLMMEEIGAAIEDACGGKDAAARRKIIREMDRLSAKVLWWIQHRPRKAPLTDIALSFQPEASKGCGCADSVPGHRRSIDDCGVGRDHYAQQSRGQAIERISLPKVAAYSLKVGE